MPSQKGIHIISPKPSRTTETQRVEGEPWGKDKPPVDRLADLGSARTFVQEKSCLIRLLGVGF